MDAFFFVFLALFFQTFLPDFSVWFRFSRCERFLQNVPGTMVFTMFSAHSHFVQTLFFQSFPFKFASKFRLFFALFFIEKMRKLAQKSVLSLISQLEALFAVFWLTFPIFGQFWRILGGLGRLVGSIFGEIWASKKEAKFERILGRVLCRVGGLRGACQD